jgi:hypothetical protein
VRALREPPDGLARVKRGMPECGEEAAGATGCATAREAGGEIKECWFKVIKLSR